MGCAASEEVVCQYGSRANANTLNGRTWSFMTFTLPPQFHFSSATWLAVHPYHSKIYAIRKVNGMVNWPAMIFSQQSMTGSCVLLPPHSGIGQGGFAISYLTSTQTRLFMQLTSKMGSWVFVR